MQRMQTSATKLADLGEIVDFRAHLVRAPTTGLSKAEMGYIVIIGLNLPNWHIPMHVDLNEVLKCST